MTAPLRIAWLTTARGPGSFGAFAYTVDAIAQGLPVEVAVVFVNRERGESEATDRFLDFATAHGVPVETLSSVRFRKARGGQRSRPGEPLPAWRTEFDREVAARLAGYDFSLGVMFGYMLIATEPLFSRFRFINDHPALPDGPVGTYQQVICELIRQGASESGCMMNLVTADVDRGPTVSFCRFAIRDAANAAAWDEAAPLVARGAPQDELEATSLYADIRRRGVEREQPFLVETLRAAAEGRLSIPPAEPLDLTAEVERAISAGAW
ncbi:MAG: hypothetical protein Kow0010_22340 [Dehalococcoidia bacterium]